MAYLVSHPDEVKVVSKRFGMGATNLDRYLELDGYKALQKALSMGPDAIINEDEGLEPARPRRRRLSHRDEVVVRPQGIAKPKYVLCNGDESEPGTCKDRLIFEHDPHAVIEGVMIAALAVGSKTGYIYMRGEYRYLIEIMEKAVADAYARGFIGKNIFGSGFDLDIYCALRRGRLRSRRRVGADGVAGRQARRAAHPSALPCRGRTLGRPHRHQQCRDAGQRAAHHSGRRRVVCRIWARRATVARACSASAANSNGPASTNCPWATT